MESTIERNLEYIKLQWEDIRHSRQQEWTALAAIAGIFYAMVKVDLPYPESLGAKIFLGLLGILSAFLGTCISWQHYTIFHQKIAVISNLERQIGIQYPMRKVRFPVQVPLFLLFGGIATAFVGITLGYVLEAFSRGEWRLWAYVFGGLVFVGVFLYALFHRTQAMKTRSYGYKHPFYAEMEDLERCLASLGNVPLKLIVEGTLDQTGIKEVPWESPQWTCDLNGELITKSVLLNQRDIFQFSLASASSRQDWHRHSSTFEVYVSDRPMELEYGEPGAKEKVCVNRGVLIVPPEVRHKVGLEGNTFVFQATLADQGISKDKDEEK